MSELVEFVHFSILNPWPAVDRLKLVVFPQNVLCWKIPSNIKVFVSDSTSYFSFGFWYNHFRLLLISPVNLWSDKLEFCCQKLLRFCKSESSHLLLKINRGIIFFLFSTTKLEKYLFINFSRRCLVNHL